VTKANNKKSGEIWRRRIESNPHPSRPGLDFESDTSAHSKIDPFPRHHCVTDCDYKRLIMFKDDLGSWCQNSAKLFAKMMQTNEFFREILVNNKH
jgi:hypothetical protein